MLIECYVQPGARKTEWAGFHDGKIKIRLKAIAQDGHANDALLAFLASELGINKSRLRIIRGEKSRHKTILVDAKIEELNSDFLKGINYGNQ